MRAALRITQANRTIRANVAKLGSKNVEVVRASAAACLDRNAAVEQRAPPNGSTRLCVATSLVARCRVSFAFDWDPPPSAAARFVERELLTRQSLCRHSRASTHIEAWADYRYRPWMWSAARYLSRALATPAQSRDHAATLSAATMQLRGFARDRERGFRGLPRQHRRALGVPGPRSVSGITERSFRHSAFRNRSELAERRFVQWAAEHTERLEWERGTRCRCLRRLAELWCSAGVSAAAPND
jgi:hypothetical protein